MHESVSEAEVPLLEHEDSYSCHFGIGRCKNKLFLGSVVALLSLVFLTTLIYSNADASSSSAQKESINILPEQLTGLEKQLATESIDISPEQLTGLEKQLATEFAEVLAKVAATEPTLALQISWRALDMDFSLAAGPVPETGHAPAHVGDSFPPGPVRRTMTSDFFLFGSGTKPLTSLAIVRLAEKNSTLLRMTVASFVDPLLGRSLLGRAHPDQYGSLRALLGGDARADVITLHQLLAMQSGIADFDVASLDDLILHAGNEEWTPMHILSFVGKQAVVFDFDPGAHVEYVSTNYVLAGLVLLALAPPDVTEDHVLSADDWYRLQMFDLVFRPEVRERYASYGVEFVGKDAISSYSSSAHFVVPGMSMMEDPKAWQEYQDGDDIPNGVNLTSIWSQSASILGFTCGNAVGTTRAMANFMYDLLSLKQRDGASALASAESVRLMEDYHPLDFGWSNGWLLYGMGLMVTSADYSDTDADDGIQLPVPFRLLPGTPGPHGWDWGSYWGHDGDTYGFTSAQGIIKELDAAFSVASNSDYNYAVPLITCHMITIAARVMNGTTINIQCPNLDE